MGPVATQIAGLIKEGRTRSEILDIVGHKRYFYVSWVKKQLGIPSKMGRPVGSFRTNPIRSRIVELKQAGYTYADIGRHYGLSHQRIQQIVARQRRRTDPPLIGDCEMCGQNTTLNRHHVNYVTDEIMLLCRACHRKQHRGKTGSRKALDYQI